MNDNMTNAEAVALMSAASDLARYYTAHCWEEVAHRCHAFGIQHYELETHLIDHGLTTSADLEDSWQSVANDGICIPCLAQTKLNENMEAISGTLTYDCTMHP